MRVGRPRVGALDAGDEVRERAGDAAAQSPNAPSTCSHAPCRVGGVGDRRQRVEGAGVHLAGLRADDRRPVASASASRSASATHASLVVGGDDDRGAPSPSSRSARSTRDVHLRAGDARARAARRRARRARRPSRLGEHVLPRGRERGDVRHLAAGDERERRMRRQAEQIAQPAAGDLLDDGRRRAGDVEAGVLIPRRREPVGGERRRERRRRSRSRSSARSGSRRRPARRPRRARAITSRGSRRLVGQRPAERGAQAPRASTAGNDRPLVERVEEVRRHGRRSARAARASRPRSRL